VSTSESPPGGPTEPSDLLGRVVADHLVLARVVGVGANTTVFDATDESTGRTVTVKLIQPGMSAPDAFRQRFDETMRRVGALSHPNIAALYDWGTTEFDGATTSYVVVEQLTGGSLRDMFDRARQLSPSQALAIGLDACRALDYAHRRGFVHTELTPSKLVFGDDRRLRITDFGLAALLNESTWRQPDAVATHTAWYASPEQGLAQPIDGKTDVYALCLTLHEAVTGTLPFKNDSTVAALAARVGRLMPVSADLGPLASVLEHAGRPEADERSSAAQFGKDLVQVASKLPRPEPLPLLSTGLFETPVEHLRAPEDPTGGVVRPPEVPEPPLIVEAEPEMPTDVTSGDDLVILPLDSEIGAAAASTTPDAPTEQPEPTEPTEPTESAEPAEPTESAAESQPERAATVTTQAMPIYTAGSPPRRRGFPWKIVLAVLVVAALTVLGILATRLFETPVYTVPDLLEMPEAEARNLVAANRWELEITRERSDLVSVVGQVVRTVPQSGVDLAVGEPFLIVVSEGPKLRELPESTGLTLPEAQTRLVERGLDVSPPLEEYDEVVPAGTIIGWSVPGDATLGAGSLVEPTTPVELVVSLGPAPRSIPDVVGMTVGTARSELVALGLTLTEVGQEFSDDIALGSVISQGFEPGTAVERGSDMTVILSKGPDIVPFPDLSDAANYEEAAAILIEAGFQPRLTFGDTLGELQQLRIDGEEAVVGETYRRGTQVDIRAL
jgi:serine/threonine-protein kinase